MSVGFSQLDEIEKAARLRDQVAPDIPVLGNGDVKSIEQGRALCQKHELDGAEWWASLITHGSLRAEGGAAQPEERLEMLWRHTAFDRV